MTAKSQAPAATPLSELIAREWLVPLGNGGYASSTVCGLASRSYHGLLVAAYPAPRGRRVLVTHVDETVEGPGGDAVELATHLYEPDVIHPEGFRAVESFSAEPLPRWRLRAGTAVIEKSLVPLTGRNAVALEYRLVDGEPDTRIEVRPFLTSRSFHGGRGPVTGDLELQDDRAVWTPRVESGGAVHIWTSAALDEEAVVYERFRHEVEASRGYDFLEDVVTPCRIHATLSPRRGRNVLRIVFSDEPLPADPWRRAATCQKAAVEPSGAIDRLAASVRSLVIRHPGSDRTGLLAGYHWFTEWGRDTMISLPGVAVAMGGWNEVGGILRAWCERLSLGMLPNRLTEEEGGDAYNSADSALWFIRAVELFLRATGDERTVRRWFFPAIREIHGYYTGGTRYGIHVDDRDGLLVAGMEGVQLTWMDAKIGNEVITPRHGKCVELNALFYSGTRFLEDLDRRFGYTHEARVAGRLARRMAASFDEVFWSDEAGHLRDCVGEGGDDGLRPNQLFALSLERSPLSEARRVPVLEACEAHLLTPYGLRTLSPEDPRYVGTYGGTQDARDRAYHQGTVWPWLIGPYVDAVLNVRGRGAAVKKAMRRALAPLVETLDRDGIGHLSEVFDGDAPHRAGGTIAQAWSAAEVLRAAVRVGLR